MGSTLTANVQVDIHTIVSQYVAIELTAAEIGLACCLAIYAQRIRATIIMT